MLLRSFFLLPIQNSTVHILKPVWKLFLILEFHVTDIYFISFPLRLPSEVLTVTITFFYLPTRFYDVNATKSIFMTIYFKAFIYKSIYKSRTDH